jgi:hypothetical protein
MKISTVIRMYGLSKMPEVLITKTKTGINYSLAKQKSKTIVPHRAILELSRVRKAV